MTETESSSSPVILEEMLVLLRSILPPTVRNPSPPTFPPSFTLRFSHWHTKFILKFQIIYIFHSDLNKLIFIILKIKIYIYISKQYKYIHMYNILCASILNPTDPSFLHFSSPLASKILEMVVYLAISFGLTSASITYL